MKKLSVLVVLLASFMISSVNAYTAEIKKGFNSFNIEAVDNVNFGTDVEKAWTLTYEGSSNPVTVVKRNQADGAAYIVSSKHFEICYLSTGKGFGARAVKKAWSKVPMQINNVVLNTEEISKQKILTPLKVDDENALGLIASYLPELFNEQYLHLLN